MQVRQLRPEYNRIHESASLIVQKDFVAIALERETQLKPRRRRVRIRVEDQVETLLYDSPLFYWIMTHGATCWSLTVLRLGIYYRKFYCQTDYSAAYTVRTDV